MRFRVGLLGPKGPIGSPFLGPGPWAPDNNVRARSTAQSIVIGMHPGIPQILKTQSKIDPDAFKV